MDVGNDAIVLQTALQIELEKRMNKYYPRMRECNKCGCFILNKSMEEHQEMCMKYEDE